MGGVGAGNDKFYVDNATGNVTVTSTSVTIAGSKAARGAQVFRYPGVAGIVGQSTNQDSYVAIGGIIVDPSEMFAGDAGLVRTITLEFLLETTLAAAAATIQLWNIDDAEALVDSGAASSWTSTSLTAARVTSASLTVGAAAGNLKNALRTYEVQLKRNGSTDVQFVTCKLAQMKFRYA